MTDSMKADEGAAPVNVGLFRTPAVVQQPDALTELIQYLGGAQRGQLRRGAGRPQAGAMMDIDIGHLVHSGSLAAESKTRLAEGKCTRQSQQTTDAASCRKDGTG
jgi:hypothetical protein